MMVTRNSRDNFGEKSFGVLTQRNSDSDLLDESRISVYLRVIMRR